MSNTLTYKEYIASVEFCAEDEVFYGRVLGINDLITFEGSDVKKLKSAFNEAVDDYLETCKELNKEPNKTYKGVFNVRVDTSVHKQAALIASQNQITLNEFVKRAIAFAIENKAKLSLS